MISYFIIDIGYSINLFLIMTVLLSYKRRRQDLIVAYLVSLLFYIIIELICRLPQLGIDVDVSFVIAGLFEIFVTFFILCIFDSGNIWRNFTLLILDFALVNALSGCLLAINSKLEAIYDRCIVHSDLSVMEAIIISIFQVASGCIVTIVLSKIVKKEYRGNGRIYMIFSLLYVVLGIVQMVFKRESISNAMDDTVGVAKIAYVIIGVVTFYIFGLLYYKLEGKRLDTENRKLEQMIRENYVRYQELVESNDRLASVKEEFFDYAKEIEKIDDNDYNREIKKLAKSVDSIAITGNIVIDSIIKKYYDVARDGNVKFEFIPCRLNLNHDKIVNIATVIENILMIAVDISIASEERWIYISVKQNDNMILINVEFSKQKGEKLDFNGNVFTKPTSNSNRIKLIKSVCDTMSGVVSVDNKKNEGSIKAAINYT